jgi:hypothetical protein
MSDLKSLKPQDVVIALKIVALGQKNWTQASLAASLDMSLTFVNQALPRLEECHLYKAKRKVVLVDGLKDFLMFGIRYVFPASKGQLVRGIPTSIGAPPLLEHMNLEALNWPPVWQYLAGSKQGYSIQPLFSGVDKTLDDREFYELLALVDVFREGRAREKKIAVDELEVRLNRYKNGAKIN